MTKIAGFFRTAFTLLGKTAASLTAVLFVLLTLGIIAGLAVDLRLLHPEAYKEAMISAGAYEVLPGLLAEQAAMPQANAPQRSGDAMLQYLKSDQREALYRYLFPPKWLRAQSEGLVDRFFAYLNLQSDKADLHISLAEVRTRVQSPDMVVYITAVMRSFPACTVDQAVRILGEVVGSGVNGVGICMPPSIDSQTVATLFQSQIASAIAGTIPDSFTIPLLENNVQSNLTGEQLQNLQFARQVLYLSPLLCLGLLLLILLFTVRSRRSLLRWWGMPLLATAVLAGAGAFSAPPLVSWYLGQSLPGSGGFSPHMVDLITRVSYNLVSSAGGFASIVAIVLGGVGAVMLLGSYVVRDLPSKPAVKPAAEVDAGLPKSEKKISPWLITLSILLPVVLFLVAAALLVLWLVSKGMLIL